MDVPAPHEESLSEQGSESVEDDPKFTQILQKYQWGPNPLSCLPWFTLPGQSIRRELPHEESSEILNEVTRANINELSGLKLAIRYGYNVFLRYCRTLEAIIPDRRSIPARKLLLNVDYAKSGSAHDFMSTTVLASLVDSSKQIVTRSTDPPHLTAKESELSASELAVYSLQYDTEDILCGFRDQWKASLEESNPPELTQTQSQLASEGPMNDTLEPVGNSLIVREPLKVVRAAEINQVPQMLLSTMRRRHAQTRLFYVHEMICHAAIAANAYFRLGQKLEDQPDCADVAQDLIMLEEFEYNPKDKKKDAQLVQEQVEKLDCMCILYLLCYFPIALLSGHTFTKRGQKRLTTKAIYNIALTPGPPRNPIVREVNHALTRLVFDMALYGPGIYKSRMDEIARFLDRAFPTVNPSPLGARISEVPQSPHDNTEDRQGNEGSSGMTLVPYHRQSKIPKVGALNPIKQDQKLKHSVDSLNDRAQLAYHLASVFKTGGKVVTDLPEGTDFKGLLKTAFREAIREEMGQQKRPASDDHIEEPTAKRQKGKTRPTHNVDANDGSDSGAVEQSNIKARLRGNAGKKPSTPPRTAAKKQTSHRRHTQTRNTDESVDDDIDEHPNDDIDELPDDDIDELPNDDIDELPNDDIEELPNNHIDQLPNVVTMVRLLPDIENYRIDGIGAQLLPQFPYATINVPNGQKSKELSGIRWQIEKSCRIIYTEDADRMLNQYDVAPPPGKHFTTFVKEKSNTLTTTKFFLRAEWDSMNRRQQAEVFRWHNIVVIGEPSYPAAGLKEFSLAEVDRIHGVRVPIECFARPRKETHVKQIKKKLKDGFLRYQTNLAELASFLEKFDNESQSFLEKFDQRPAKKNKKQLAQKHNELLCDIPPSVNALGMKVNESIPLSLDDFTKYVHRRSFIGENGECYTLQVPLTVEDLGRHWMILGGSGSYSNLHVDQGGAAAFIEVVKKEDADKIFILPIDSDVLPWETREKIVCDFIRMKAGYTLLLRPGQVHATVTPKTSLCIGGHFYSWNNIAYTLVSLVREHFCGSTYTNEHKPSTALLFIRAACAVAEKYFQPDEIGSSSEENIGYAHLACLIVIIEHLCDLTKFTFDGDPNPILQSPGFKHDMQRAKVASKAILDHNKKNEYFMSDFDAIEESFFDECIRMDMECQRHYLEEQAGNGEGDDDDDDGEGEDDDDDDGEGEDRGKKGKKSVKDVYNFDLRIPLRHILRGQKNYTRQYGTFGTDQGRHSSEDGTRDSNNTNEGKGSKNDRVGDSGEDEKGGDGGEDENDGDGEPDGEIQQDRMDVDGMIGKVDEAQQKKTVAGSKAVGNVQAGGNGMDIDDEITQFTQDKPSDDLDDELTSIEDEEDENYTG